MRTGFTEYVKDIKVLHTVFALPFALAAFFLYAENITTGSFFLMCGCFLFARSFAMGANRFFDRHYDGLNARTISRAIPSGALTSRMAFIWTVLSAVGFVALSFQFNLFTGILAFPVILLLMGYSLLKRFTVLTHWYLGCCLGLAPLAVSVALTGRIAPNLLLLSVAIVFWTAGFDIIYAIQDEAFDKEMGLKSIPARVGVARALLISRFCFLTAISAFLWFGYGLKLGYVYYGGVLIIALILGMEQWFVRNIGDVGDERAKVPTIELAFFKINCWVSIVFFSSVILDHFYQNV